MKQLIPIFLFLLPCFAWAQYPSNGNQKITLGEQTSADGLIFRGAAADTVSATLKITKTNKQDTSTYLLLDTLNNVLLKYNIATTYWTRLNLLPSDTASMLTNYYRSGRALGTPSTGSILTNATGLPISTGLTGLGAANRIPFTSSATALTTTNKFTFDPSGNKLIIGKNDTLDSNPNYTINLSGSDSPSPGLGFRLYNTTLNKISLFKYDNNHSFVFFNNDADNGLGAHRFNIGSGNGEEILTVTRSSPGNGKVGVNQSIPTEALHVVGNARITAMNGIGDIGADANGVLQAATSDMNLKNTIENSPFGLNEILLLNPVTFLYNDTNRKIDSNVKEVGFIAQDVFDIIPNAVSSTGTGDLQLDYRAITATLVKAIQEQQAQIEALKQRIINLENK